MKKNLIFTFLLLFSLGSNLFAQERTVSGKITNASDGLPIFGVNIAVVGTSQGTVSDADGNYSIKVSSDEATLSFSFIGFTSKKIKVAGQSVINVALESSDISLEDVVVTALGIKREKKALTYSAENVGGDELTKVKDADPMNALSGKVAGLTINKSASGTGGSVKVLIRGNSSTTNNQPLYIIDGVPMLNSTPHQQ